MTIIEAIIVMMQFDNGGGMPSNNMYTHNEDEKKKNGGREGGTFVVSVRVEVTSKIICVHHLQAGGKEEEGREGGVT